MSQCNEILGWVVIPLDRECKIQNSAGKTCSSRWSWPAFAKRLIAMSFPPYTHALVRLTLVQGLHHSDHAYLDLVKVSKEQLCQSKQCQLSWLANCNVHEQFWSSEWQTRKDEASVWKAISDLTVFCRKHRPWPEEPCRLYQATALEPKSEQRAGLKTHTGMMHHYHLHRICNWETVRRPIAALVQKQVTVSYFDLGSP